MKEDILQYLIEHIFLPPKLPQELDPKYRLKDNALLDLVTDAAARFAGLPIPSEDEVTQDLEAWEFIRRMLQNMKHIHNEGCLDRHNLQAALECMKPKDVLPVFIEAQNAAVILRKIAPDILTFEAFQVTLPCEVIMKALGKVSVRYPSNPRLAFPADKEVLSTLANVLAHLSMNFMKEAVPLSQKGGESHRETRDVPSPRFITEALAGIIRATPPHRPPTFKTMYIHKRIDDHVLWKDAFKPWRRSSMWLIIRVAMQTTLKEWDVQHQRGYKSFQAFLMARVLNEAASGDPERFTCDILSIMNAKLAKRLYKLAALLGDSSLTGHEEATGAVIRVSNVLEARWKEIQHTHESISQWRPSLTSSLDTEKCTELSFPNSRPFLLELISQHSLPKSSSHNFQPEIFEATLERSLTIRASLSSFDLVTALSNKDTGLGLYELEAWIESHLQDWEKSSARSERDCLPLASLIEKYRDKASTHYDGNPERVSLMHLCILELWISLDKICIKWAPLLEKYSPEIARDFVEPLVLPYSSQMKRLGCVQTYLNSRHVNAIKQGGNSIFRSVNAETSFQNQFFNYPEAQPLITLENKIRTTAAKERAAKVLELEERNRRYETLMAQAEGLDCTPSSNEAPFQSHAKKKCPKCKLQKTAKKLKIVPYEDPLPEHQTVARPIIFELQCPQPFACWRDTTIKIMLSVSSVQPKPDPHIYSLKTYEPLRVYFRSPYEGYRISFASSAKSLQRSHYGAKCAIPASESQVLHRHMGSFGVYDAKIDGWLHIGSNDRLRPACTFKLEGTYAVMQEFVNDTHHPPNSVLTSISRCPLNISPPEYIAFGLLRAGNRVQWRNIMRAIKSRSLSFAEPGTFALITQSIWQAGPLGDRNHTDLCYREAHIDLFDESFGIEVVAELLDATKRLRGNWKEAGFLALIILLALRVQAFSPHSSVHQQTMRVIREARIICLVWIMALSEASAPPKHPMSKQPSQGSMNQTAQTLASVAIVLRASFDIEDECYARALQSNVDVVHYILTSILMNGVHLESLPPSFKALASRNNRVALSIEPYLVKLCLETPSILGHVVKLAWPRYSNKGHWTALPNCHGYWWSSFQKNDGMEASQYFHLNILDGTFLIDGRNLDRLPTAYESHSTYRALFQDHIFRAVRPSLIPGMEYQSHFGAYDVHFSMNGQTLRVVRRTTMDMEEYISADRLSQDLPISLCSDQCFWYSKKSSTIEIRHSSEVWAKNNGRYWTIHLSDFAEKGISWIERSTMAGSLRLVNPQSELHLKLNNTLFPLEPNARGVVTTVFHTAHDSPLITVHLPRHDLTFSLCHNTLECVSLPGYIVDTNLAGIGCLFGLNGILNLRTSDHRQPGRKIIIPKGSISVKKGKYGHTNVTINIGESNGYFVYDVDDVVGRLIGTRTMESDLFLAAIHAFTAFPMADPLTGRTGTTEALDRLASAGSYSYHTISAEARAYLEVIGDLTPLRSFYPTHLQVMERIEWHKVLPSFAQHPEFQSKIDNILLNWEEMEVFHRKDDVTQKLAAPEGFGHLNTRAKQRECYQRSHPVPYDFADDHVHLSRDSLTTMESKNREQAVFQAVVFTQGTSSKLPVCQNLRDTVLGWNGIAGVQHWGWEHIEHWLDGSIAPSIADVWCHLYELCRQLALPRFDASVVLAFQCFRGVPLELIATLGAVINRYQKGFATSPCPKFSSLQLADGSVFTAGVVQQRLRRFKQSFEESLESSTPGLYLETNSARISRARQLYQTAVGEEANRIVAWLADNWPENTTYPLIQLRLFEPAKEILQGSLQSLLISWAKNKEYLQHIETLQHQVNEVWSPARRVVTYSPPNPPQQPMAPRFRPITLQQCMIESIPGSRDTIMSDLLPIEPQGYSDRTPSIAVDRLLNRLDTASGNAVERSYVASLRESWTALKSHASSKPTHVSSGLSSEALATFHSACMEHSRACFESLCHYLRPESRAVQLMYRAGAWLSITPQTLLQCLTLKNRIKISDAWKSQLIRYAVSIHDVKRARRMLRLAQIGERNSLEREVQYTRAWEPEKQPDWLLVEIDLNISIRPTQATIAEEMLRPDGDLNTVMQLNMGEGKSSVIVPIVAISASGGDTLARVIVPRAQMKQQFHTLRQAVTGLCGRRIIYLPFNRSLNLDDARVLRIQELLHSSASEGTIWVCEPEHLLSLKMLGLDKSLRNIDHKACAQNLISLYLWLHKHSKDILDESDEILHTRQQVVYTVGPQQALDAAPLRWEAIQKLLGLLEAHLKGYSGGTEANHFLIEASLTKGAFPNIRIHSEAARIALHQFIGQSIRNCDWPIPPHMHDAVIEFVTTKNPSEAIVAHIRSCCSSEDGNVMQLILILRGLIGCEILMDSFRERRWRVHYGLDLRRSQLAIPFRAKDSPSPRSEFGHPEVIILLTCLSYYYYGLDVEMFRLVLQSLVSSEAPELTYAEWIRSYGSDVPLSLRVFGGINLQDQEQLRSQVFPLLRYNKRVIDFYLNVFVFPRCAKEFPSKMSTSGWDLAIAKPNPTTGFSGTNDGRYLLPVTIKQTDNDDQLHTNAKVLSCILEESNSSVVYYPNFIGSIGLLERIHELSSKPTVILDVGAQILDLSNLDFAKSWLAMYRDHPIVKAAVFFDEGSNMLVVTPDGTTQPFIDSPYSGRLDQCLIYLDEAHTRGTDLRIPDAKAIVTLGPKLSKDKLVQGCMRMRKLGQGHSLIFMASKEVISLVRQAVDIPSGNITIEDIMVWSIKETWQQLYKSLPLWARQGYSSMRHEIKWNSISSSEPPYLDVSSHFCEPEAQTLQQLYGNDPTTTNPIDGHQMWKKHSVVSHDELAQKISRKLIEFGSPPLRDSKVDEEMEIELIHEKEVEREVERAPDAQPAAHVLHPMVQHFAATGDVLLCRGNGFLSAAAAFQSTSLAIPTDFDKVMSNLVITEDFWRTIQIPRTHSSRSMDHFIRSVDWVVTAMIKPSSLLMVLISPYEANELLPTFRTSTTMKLHVYAPRTNFAVPSLEDLNYLTLPSTPNSPPLPRALALQLNLFSGSLYLRDYKTYRDVCRVLRLYFEALHPRHARPEIINASFFVLDPNARKELGMGEFGFQTNALAFFQNMIKLRRFGRGFGPSHMGKILYGTRLKQSDFVEETPDMELDEDIPGLDG